MNVKFNINQSHYIVCIFKSCQPDVCEETTFVMLVKYYKMNNCLFMADCLQQICWWEGCIKYKHY